MGDSGLMTCTSYPGDETHRNEKNFYANQKANKVNKTFLFVLIWLFAFICLLGRFQGNCSGYAA